MIFVFHTPRALPACARDYLTGQGVTWETKWLSVIPTKDYLCVSKVPWASTAFLRDTFQERTGITSDLNFISAVEWSGKGTLSEAKICQLLKKGKDFWGETLKIELWIFQMEL